MVSERNGGEGWLRAEALGRFEDGEASLAYRWVLLNPSNASFPGDPGLTELARKGWAVADGDSSPSSGGTGCSASGSRASPRD